MRAAIVAGVCVALAAGGAAQAGLEKGTYAPDIEAKEWINSDEPISLAELRGMTVVLFFWVSWHEGGEYVMPLMNIVNSRVGRSRGVFLIGLTDASRARIEEMLKKEKVFFPIGVESKTAEEYKITSYPHAVVIDARGRVAWTGWPGKGGEESLIKQIFDTLQETPATKTHPAEAAIAERSLAEARKALREDNYQEAFKAAQKAEEHALTGDRLRARCQDMLELIEALGRERLAQAERAADEKRFEDAVALLRGIGRDFRGMEVTKAARRKLDALRKKHGEVAKILERGDEAALAENELARALKEFRGRRFGKGYERLEELINDYPASEAAAKAKTVLERARKNAGLMDYVRDHKASRECETMLFQARAYEHAGKPNKAKELYRKVLAEYGDTVYADEAARRLARLP